MVLAVLTSVSDVFADAAAPSTVLAIHWGAEDFPATPLVNEAIRQGLTSDARVPIRYFAEYLESDVFDPVQASEALAGYIRRKYRGSADRRGHGDRRPVPAIRSLDHRTELFPDAAIVYSGVAVPESSGGSADGFTGILRSAAYVGNTGTRAETAPVHGAGVRD